MNFLEFLSAWLFSCKIWQNSWSFWDRELQGQKQCLNLCEPECDCLRIFSLDFINWTGAKNLFSSCNEARTYDQRFCTKRDVSILRLQGCRAFMYVSKQRRKVLTDRGEECFFIGDGTGETYRIMSKKSKKVTSFILEESKLWLDSILAKVSLSMSFTKINTLLQ